MATTAGDIYVRSGASGSFTSVQYVQGGWITVDSGSDMTSLYHDRLKDGQIIYVQSTDEAYKVKKFVAFETPGYGGSDNSASFHSFNFLRLIDEKFFGSGLPSIRVRRIIFFF